MIVGYGFLVLVAVYFLNKKHTYVTVYEGNESNLKEAMDYYWVLKGKNIPIRYDIPYNMKNLYSIGYYESPVRIGVLKKDETKAREALRDFRAEKWRMARNIADTRMRQAII